VGDVYQGEAHPASQGSATVNINGKPAVRIGDSVGGHATACTGSPNVFIGDSSYGAAQANRRPVYEFVLTQVPGSADPRYVYANYPYKLYRNGRLVQQGRSDANGIVSYEYEPPLKGVFKFELGNGDVLEGDLTPLAPASTREGIMQRARSLAFFHNSENEDNTASALGEMNSRQGDRPVDGVLDAMKSFIKAKMP
jgi:hypothetical protein